MHLPTRLGRPERAALIRGGLPFDTLARRIAGSTPTRRTTLRLAIGAVVGAALGQAGPADDSLAADACVNVGRRCRRDGQCCSGRCRGQKGKKRCRAHGVGSCRAGQSFCRDGSAAACNDDGDCDCFQTTGGASFCGRTVVSVDCARDADCVRLGVAPGAACVRRDGSRCEVERETFCVTPCAAQTPPT